MKNLKNNDDTFVIDEGVEKLHQESQIWVSEVAIWKKELAFFQTLLDKNASKCTTVDQKQSLDHFQNLIIYYNGELLDAYAKKTRKHTKLLAQHIENDTIIDNIDYHDKHAAIKNEMESFKKEYYNYKSDFFEFISSVI